MTASKTPGKTPRVSRKTEERENLKTRPARTPVSGARAILDVYGKDPDYYYYWALDESEQGAKIFNYLNAGFEFVKDDGAHTVGAKSVYESTKYGSLIRRPAQDGRYLFLMRQPMQFHLEDKAAKARLIDETEATMRDVDIAEGQYLTESSIQQKRGRVEK